MQLKMKNICKRITISLLLLVSIASLSAAPKSVHSCLKRGYFTSVYIRESPSDTPRNNYLIIGEDGEITPVWFFRYNSKAPGELNSSRFNPKEYLGKVVEMDFVGTATANNNEFPIYDKSGELKLLKRYIVTKINSLQVLDDKIAVDKRYEYPQSDTLIVPHDISLKRRKYSGGGSNKVVQLSNYVKGDGSPSSPYTSADGSAGLLKAFAALPKGGTIVVPAGHYRSTATKIKIPTYINICGKEGDETPTFDLTTKSSWMLQGCNRIERIKVDVSNLGDKYVGEVVIVDNGAKDVTIRDVHFQGGYTVDPESHKSTNHVVCVRLMSELDNITFERCRFSNIMRSLVTKGQRSQHNITIRESLFEEASHMCISFDQVSDMSNILLENNTFKEFSHFGTAFARITNVTMRGNTFYTRNTLSVTSYNHPIHIEEFCQNFLLEDNIIDIVMRLPDSAAATARTCGLSIKDSRNVTIRNNAFSHCNIAFEASHNWLSGSILCTKNTIRDGQFTIDSGCNRVSIIDNDIDTPPTCAFAIGCKLPELSPTWGHIIERNRIVGLNGTMPFRIEGNVVDSKITANKFSGENQLPYSLKLSSMGRNVEVGGNTF